VATPRLAWVNRLAGSGLVVRASSQQAGLPAAYAVDPLRTRPWWSAAGYNLTADRLSLDFVEDGVAKVATLTAGNYATPALMAAHATAKVNAVAGIVNTYLVSWTAGRVTFARTGGTKSISLPFATGANRLTSVHGMLGFADTDVSGSTSYAAGYDSYHSWEWLKVDAGAAVSVQFAAALNHNAGAAGTIRLQGNASDAWTAPSVDEQLSTAGEDGLSLVRWLSAAQTYRYWRMVVKDSANSAGYSALGLAWAGPLVEPSAPFDREYVDGTTLLSERARSTHGAVWTDARPTYKTRKIKWRSMLPADRVLLDAVADGAGYAPLFFAMDAVGDPTRIRYGCIADRGEWTPSGNDALWASDWMFEEHVG
jgi:hypothetical protein